jgi:hypothetical protein
MGGTKMSRLINRSELKRYLLDRAQMLRPALGMRHVSNEAVQSLESRLSNMADDMIRRQPCMGRTIKP